jgi:hypothetical protein
MVHNRITRNLIEPALKTGLIPEAGDSGVDFDEHFLKDIIYNGCVWNASMNEATKLLSVLVPDSFDSGRHSCLQSSFSNSGIDFVGHSH